MSDIVERLRELEACETELAHECDCPPEATANWKYAETCRLAAAEIERLKCAIRLIAEHPVEQSQQWEVGAKEMLKLARSTHSYKP